MCYTLPGDTALDYLLYYAFRYYSLLSALLCLAMYYNHYLLRSTLPGDLPGDTMYNRLPALLYLLILQPAIRSTDYPLYSVWRYSNRPYAVPFSVCRYSNRPSDALYFTLYAITTTDYPLCSETATASFRSETERLTALLCLAVLQPTICCASLLPL
jgi:hypothetical protein